MCIILIGAHITHGPDFKGFMKCFPIIFQGSQYDAMEEILQADPPPDDGGEEDNTGDTDSDDMIMRYVLLL